jgi:hypothetical protein
MRELSNPPMEPFGACRQHENPEGEVDAQHHLRDCVKYPKQFCELRKN